MDEVMKKTAEGEWKGRDWDIPKLEDLDFADDICLLSHTFVVMKKKLRDF